MFEHTGAEGGGREEGVDGADAEDRGGGRVLVDDRLDGAGATVVIDGEGPGVDGAQQGLLAGAQLRQGATGGDGGGVGRVEVHADQGGLDAQRVEARAQAASGGRAAISAATRAKSGRTTSIGLRSHSTTTARRLTAR